MPQNSAVSATSASPGISAQTAPPYADIADLVIASPIIADATIRSALKLKGADSAGVAPGMTRYYVEADLVALVRGAGGLPPRIGYLLDVAPDSAGRQPKLKKLRVLLFGRSVPGTPDQIQLVAPDAQIPGPRPKTSASARSRRASSPPMRRRSSPASAMPSTYPARCPEKARRRCS